MSLGNAIVVTLLYIRSVNILLVFLLTAGNPCVFAFYFEHCCLLILTKSGPHKVFSSIYIIILNTLDI